MSEKLPSSYEKAIGAFNDSERRVLSTCGCIGWAEYPYVGQSLICGRHGMTEITVINPDEATTSPRSPGQADGPPESVSRTVPSSPVASSGSEWVPLSERLPWHFTDRYVRPNAWPRFSIWPFRLRRGGRQ